MAAAFEERLRRLTAGVLTPAVQAQEPAEAEEEPLRLSDREIEQVFLDHVPGVRDFLFRGKPGLHSLRFMVSVYKDGLQGFRGTALQNHLLWCMRYVVHQGHNRRPGVAPHLVEVAEAFRECQAVQARAIERAALQLRNVTPDFPGLLTRFVGEYKTLALKMLAAERLAQGLATDYDPMPTHYENRLTADLGLALGANADDVRLAALDDHARKRFAPLAGEAAAAAASRCRELFDARAMLQAFVAEVNSFSAESPQESLPCVFLRWVAEHLQHRHIVLDEETACRTSVDMPLALCIFEHVFLGKLGGAADEAIRGVPARELFLPAHDEWAPATTPTVCTKDACSEAMSDVRSTSAESFDDHP